MNSSKPYSGFVYIGTYGSKDEPTIHMAAFNGATGELDIVQSVAGVENASYLAIHPEGHRLYATCEVAETDGEAGGAVYSFEVDRESGRIGRETSRVMSMGGHPCYISTDTQGSALFVANYTGGIAAVLPITAGGELTAANSAELFIKKGGNPDSGRQDRHHAHCAIQLEGTPFICVADLGADAIAVYRYDEQRQAMSYHSCCELNEGAGPRHLVFHQHLPYAYVANECNSTVTALTVDKANGQLEVLHTLSTIPADYTAYNDSADIHVSPDGRYLYSSNRGHNSIAVFAIDSATGRLSLKQVCGSGGELPRNFGITPDGAYLLAANMQSGNIVTYTIDKENGTIAPAGIECQVASPVCIRFSI